MLKIDSRNMLYIAAFFVLVLLLWFGLLLLPEPAQIQLPGDVQGGYDLTHADVKDTIYTIAPVWDSWPEALYTPEALAGAEAPVPHESLDYTQVQYATHRLRITLAPGMVYGLSYYTSDYSMRLYIDGVEAASAGSPGTTREETRPRVHKLTTYFTPQHETAEFVVQAANFVHREGGRAPMLSISSADSIARHARNSDLKTGLVVGCLISAFLYYLAIFLLNRRQVSLFLFSMLCLMLALTSGDFLVRLIPVYNWQAAIRGEYISYVLAGVMLTLLVHTMFPRALHTWCLKTYLSLSGGYIGLILFTGSVFFTGLLMGFQLISIVMIVYGITCLALTLREKKLKNILAFLGILLFALSIVADILIRHNVQAVRIFSGVTFISGGGMVLFVFYYAMVLSIEQAEINARLEESRTALAAAEAHYHKRSKQTSEQRPLAKLSDFGLTKRETEVALLLLNGKSREEITALLCISLGTVNFHCNNLYRKAGVSGVGGLASLMLPKEQWHKTLK